MKRHKSGKSQRQLKIEKHATIVLREKKRKRIALLISALIVSVPFCLKYFYS